MSSNLDDNNSGDDWADDAAWVGDNEGSNFGDNEVGDNEVGNNEENNLGDDWADDNDAWVGNNEGNDLDEADLTIDDLSNNAQIINIEDMNLSEPPNLKRFKELKTFICRYNPMGHLPILPDCLEILDCESCDLTELPEILPSKLQKLLCGSNPFKKFPNLSSLKYLVEINIYDCGIENITNLPPNLKILNCSHNKITNFTTFPLKLEVLNISDNKLEELPFLPTSLITLKCKKNNLPSFYQNSLKEIRKSQKEYYDEKNQSINKIMLRRTPQHLPGANANILSYLTATMPDKYKSLNSTKKAGKRIKNKKQHKKQNKTQTKTKTKIQKRKMISHKIKTAKKLKRPTIKR